MILEYEPCFDVYYSEYWICFTGVTLDQSTGNILHRKISKSKRNIENNSNINAMAASLRCGK